MRTKILSPIFILTALFFSQCGIFQPKNKVEERDIPPSEYERIYAEKSIEQRSKGDDPGADAMNAPTMNEKGVIGSSEEFHPIVDWARNGVIYEVNVRQYTQEGTFNAFAKHLPRLKNLGVDILWFMPIQPIGVLNRKGELGSYYSIKDYTAINPEFGTMEDFLALIKTAHEMGFKVILDWVGNHTAWDHAWIKDHPDFYVHNDSGKIVTPWDWTDVAQLDYSEENLQTAMINAMDFWLDKGLDGFRCDVSFLVPVRFWERARTVLQGKHKQLIYMLAEMEWNTDKESNPAKYMNQAFDSYYGWTFHGKSAELAQGKIDAATFLKTINQMRDKFPITSMPMYFITNHDENTWNGTVEEKYGDKWKLFSTLAYTMPMGIPLIYSGEEANNKKRLDFFKKDPIKWGDTTRFGWYRSMNKLRETHPAMRSSLNVETTIHTSPVAPLEGISTGIYCFTRTANNQNITVIANLSDEAIPVDFSRFVWAKNLNPKQIFAGEKYVINGNTNTLNSIHMNPWGFIIIQH